MDWVTQQHVSNPGQKSVANMSLGGDFSSSVNAAVERMVAAGIVVAVSTGNDNGDACSKSPASAASAITVRTNLTAVHPFRTLELALTSLLPVWAFLEPGSPATRALQRSVELRWHLHMWLVLLPYFSRMEASAQTKSLQLVCLPRRSKIL